jgi:hypothetical protein
MMAPKARWFTKEFRDARFGGNGSYALPESQARSPGSWGVARRPANSWLRSLSSPHWHSHSRPLTQPDGLKYLCRLNESSWVRPGDTRCMTRDASMWVGLTPGQGWPSRDRGKRYGFRRAHPIMYVRMHYYFSKTKNSRLTDIFTQVLSPTHIHSPEVPRAVPWPLCIT